MAHEERAATDSLVETATADEQHDATGLPGGALLERMFREGYAYDFFQATWLLEQTLEDATPPGESIDLAHERIRFRPHTSTAFPGADIREVEWLEEEERARVTVTFMGLYGVSAALPVYFYNDIATEAYETYPLRDFLDIFNHRLYAFFYRAWKKYRPSLFRQGEKANRHQRIFESVAGLGTPGVVRPEAVPARRLAAFAGFLAHAVRSAEGLTRLASDLLDLPVRIIENVERWVPIRERPQMGGTGSRAARLGINTVVGQRVRDVSGKFRLVVGPLNLAQYVSLLPDGAQAAVLAYAARLYATDYLDYDVELQLKTSDVPPAKLGGGQRMGMDMWLGRPAGDLISVVVDYN